MRQRVMTMFGKMWPRSWTKRENDHSPDEAALRQSNEYLELVYENSPDAIGLVDGDGRFIKWNRAASELFGYTLEELSGKTAFDLYADHQELREILEGLRQNASVKKRKVQMKKKDGSIAPFEISIALLHNANGETIGSVCVARDISD